MKSVNSKKIIIATAVTFAFASPAMAKTSKDFQAKQDKAVAVGLGSGAVAGALVAGPVGAVVGGMIGAMLGNDTVQDAELQAKTDALNSSQASLFALRDEISDIQQQAKITRVAYEEVSQPGVLALQSTVQFKTASDNVEPVYHDQLNLIAGALRKLPSLSVRVTGYADNRGDANYNTSLSEARAQKVKTWLVENGAKESQVLTIAKGEEGSKGQSYEETFFDRRVVLEIADNGEAMTASR